MALHPRGDRARRRVSGHIKPICAPRGCTYDLDSPARAAAPVILILDNPGAREDREGAPFVCGTRQALLTAAQEAGLGPEEDLYVTWVLKWRPLRAYNKEAVRGACLPYLAQQIDMSTARVLVLMGNVALQAVLRDPTLEVKALRGQRLTHKGLPTICSYHPLAVRRRPNLMPYLVQDLRLAAEIAFPSLNQEFGRLNGKW